LSLEQAALQIRAYEAQFVHGLLQTEAYARALLGAGNPHASTEATERRVALRMRRQELLTREQPPRLWVVMDETVLRWP
ncbi:transcriptional regulator, partial [Streptomyces sp. JV178]